MSKQTGIKSFFGRHAGNINCNDPLEVTYKPAKESPAGYYRTYSTPRTAPFNTSSMFVLWTDYDDLLIQLYCFQKGQDPCGDVMARFLSRNKEPNPAKVACAQSLLNEICFPRKHFGEHLNKEGCKPDGAKGSG